MNKKKSLIIIIAAALLVAAGIVIPLVACSHNKPVKEPDPVPHTLTLGGESDTHYNRSVATSEFLVKTTDNITATDYKLLIPSTETATLRTAVEELKFFFKESTGIILTEVPDNAMVNGERYISLGDTLLYSASGMTKHPDLGTEGATVKSKDKNIFIYGGSDYGTLYAVYEFLRSTFSYEFYSADCYDLERNVTEKVLYDYDILEIPDFENRVAGWGYSTINSSVKNRLRYHTVDDVFTAVGNKTFHNAFLYLPVDDYFSKHPKWYSPNTAEGVPVQLCHTAQGDEAELDAMISTIVDLYKDMFISNPFLTQVTFTMNDNLEWCKCPTCTASRMAYNDSDAAVVIKFLNRVVDELDTWLAGDGAEYARDYKIAFLAYHQLNNPPAKKVNDAYAPVDSSVIPKKNIAIFFADTNADYTYTWETDESTVAVRYRENLKAWASLATDCELYWWFYSTCYANFLTPYNCFNGYGYYYTLAKELGVNLMYCQGDTSQMGPAPGWGILKGYLASKLGWNADYNVDYLIQKFFEGHYGAGAEDMMTVFEEWLGFSVYQRDELGVSGSRSVFLDYQSSEYWPKGLLSRWLTLSDSAYEKAMAAGGDNAERYATNVAVERTSWEYLYLYNYSSTLLPTHRKALQDQFKNDVLNSGITMFSERVNISEAFRVLGID